MGFAKTIIFLALTQLAVSAESAEPLERLRAHVAVDLITGVAPSEIAGHYSSNPKELGRSVLSGNDLYLFPDGSYLYSEWADIEPTTIRDKGTWIFSDGVVKLTSDPEITWEPDAERSYLVIHRKSEPKEVLLIGTDRALSYFEEKANNDADFTLLLAAKTRIGLIGQKSAPKLRRKLMREAWRPDYFRLSEK